jgi:hypothetical protein
MMTLDYEAWVRWVFAHPAMSANEPPWYSEANDDVGWSEEDNPRLTLEYMTRLFEQSRDLVGRYTAEQIGQGLWFLCDPSNSSHLFPLRDTKLEAAARHRAISAIHTLYSDVFSTICQRKLVHLEVGTELTGRANTLCYMLWEVAPLGPHHDASSNSMEDDLLCLEVMKRILDIPHLACQESALHGLGHWATAYPEQVQGLINGFLATQAAQVPELAAYARRAQSGNVL